MLGLSHIREPWTIALFEKISVEDGQWVVRNVAAQALEAIKGNISGAPKPLTPLHEAAWLIEFASQRGRSVAPDPSPIDLLLDALRTGTAEEKLCALQHLQKTSHADEGVVRAIFEQMYRESGKLQDAASYAAWLLAISGAAIPSPSKYGYG